MGAKGEDRDADGEAASELGARQVNPAAPVDGVEERLLTGVLGRIRDVRVGPDGYLYLLSDESDGVIARVEPTGG